MSNARETTPHHIGQVHKAVLLVADRLEAWGLSEPHERAAWLLERLQTDLGWTPPRDLTEKPPLRPDNPAGDDSPGRREFNQARAALAARRRGAHETSTSTSRTVHQRGTVTDVTRGQA